MKRRKNQIAWQVCSSAEGEREITGRKDAGSLEESNQSRTRTRNVEQEYYREPTNAGGVTTMVDIGDLKKKGKEVVGDIEKKKKEVEGEVIKQKKIAEGEEEKRRRQEEVDTD